MIKFCKSCDNILIEKIINNELMFKCQSCSEVYKSTPEDSLRKERIKDINVMSSKTLDNAINDPATIKANIKCIRNECKGNIVKQVRMNDTSARLYNICTTCGVQWLSN